MLRHLFLCTTMILSLFCFTVTASARDLDQIKASGALRHLGLPYANFISGSGDGMEVELTKAFAKHIGVKYEFVKTDWDSVITDLVGKKFMLEGGTVKELGEAPVKGDIVANGFTILPWRKTIVNFSTPTFPSQIWLIARADSRIKPIRPSGQLVRDIKNTKALMKGHSVLTLAKTCLEPTLYNLEATGANIINFQGALNELAPAIIHGDAELTILDVPDALVALDKWKGKLKIIGPISDKQEMAAAFPKDAPRLLAAYNSFISKMKKDGTYMSIVNRYYPTAYSYFPQFFSVVR